MATLEIAARDLICAGHDADTVYDMLHAETNGEGLIPWHRVYAVEDALLGE